MINWLSLMMLVFAAFCITACSTFSGKTGEKKDPITNTEKVPGTKLVKITTQSGHIVEVNPDTIPRDEHGNPYWIMATHEPDQKLEGLKEGVGYIPGVGDYLAGGLTLLTLFGGKTMLKQKQLEIDKRLKAEGKVTMAEKILIAADVAIDVGTTDGTIRKEFDKRLTKKELAIKDKITEGARVAVAAAKSVVAN